ncbi:MAG: ABC transporter permease [Nitrososphaerota archaeon]
MKSGYLIVAAHGLGVAVSLGATYIIIQALGKDPNRAYASLLIESLGGYSAIAETLVVTTPILLTGLALIPAFTAKFWNIGAEGQLHMGAIFSTLGVLAVSGLSPAVGLPVLVLLGFAGGAIWGLIPALLKTRFGANEVITSLMLTFVAMLITSHLVATVPPWGIKPPESLQLWSYEIPEHLRIPKLVPGTRLHAGFLIGIALVPLMWWILNFTVLGYGIRAVGSSEKAARYGGIDTVRTLLMVGMVSGGISGLAGMIEIFAVNFHLVDGFSLGFGFTGIVVALLGRQNPYGALMIAILMGVLTNGGFAMQRGAGVPVAVVSFFVGSVLALTVVFETIFRWMRRG